MPSKEAVKLINEILDFDLAYPSALEPEFLDFLKVVANGAKKYPPPVGARANWLTPNGGTSSHKDMHDRMFHHLARSFANFERQDNESGLDHLLHLACRAMMVYIRISRDIRHDDDVHEGTHCFLDQPMPESKL